MVSPIMSATQGDSLALMNCMACYSVRKLFSEFIMRCERKVDMYQMACSKVPKKVGGWEVELKHVLLLQQDWLILCMVMPSVQCFQL